MTELKSPLMSKTSITPSPSTLMPLVLSRTCWELCIRWFGFSDGGFRSRHLKSELLARKQLVSAEWLPWAHWTFRKSVRLLKHQISSTAVLLWLPVAYSAVFRDSIDLGRRSWGWICIQQPVVGCVVSHLLSVLHIVSFIDGSRSPKHDDNVVLLECV